MLIFIIIMTVLTLTGIICYTVNPDYVKHGPNKEVDMKRR